MKHQFRNDYSVLAHEKVIEALKRFSNECNGAYGLDKHSANAAKLIKNIFGCQKADVHFIAGGTQTNMTLISYALKHYEGVICVDSGHINVHETAAIEGSGHKVYIVKGKNGKIYPEDVDEAIRLNTSEHMVKLSLVYISNTTEIGTFYTKDELVALSECCKKHKLLLFMDGARLGSALASVKNDVNPELIGKCCDAFYVGGTKNGLMFGEALVLVNNSLKKDFRYHIKNKGAMLAKGFGVGIQFEAIFKNNLYFDIAKQANEGALIIQNYLIEKGFECNPTYTNQIFFTCEKRLAHELIKKFGCEVIADFGKTMNIRIVTSFATTRKDVNLLIGEIEKHVS